MITFQSENHLEQFLFSRVEKGLHPILKIPVDYAFAQRQFHASAYGIMDIVICYSVDSETYVLEVIELKVNAIKAKDVAQTAKYLRFFTKSFEDIQEYSIDLPEIILKATLIGAKPSGDDCFLLDLIDDIDFYYFDISPDDGFSITNANDLGWYRSVEKEILCSFTQAIGIKTIYKDGYIKMEEL